MVTRQNVTTFDMLDETMDTLKKTGTQIMGVIMLGDEIKGKRHGYKYGDENPQIKRG